MKKRSIICLLLCVSIIFALVLTGCNNNVNPADSTESATEAVTEAPAADGIDYMALVNKTHALPDTWEDKLETVHMTNSVGDDVEVEKKAYDAYLKLKEALEAEDIHVDLDSARRSVEAQQRIMDDFTEKYGADYAAKTVAKPGYSEHHTGLALDCGLEYVGTSVIYLSKTTLRHYYRVIEPSKFTDEIKNGVTFDSKAVTCGEKNGMIYFDKKDIAASQLDTEYAIRINGHDYHYAALDYSALANGKEDKPYSESITKQLAASVYRYNQAANEFFAD